MELDELKKIWDSQNQPIYMVDQDTLHRHVISKKNSGDRIVQYSEVLSIVANVLGGGFILTANLMNGTQRISLYLLSVWMFAVGLYVIIKRVNRLRGEKQFDRSMIGDVRYALNVALYQVRLSFLMRWNIIPIGIFVLLAIWEGTKSIWLAFGVMAFLGVALYASGFEHNAYVRRKRELERFKEKLESE